jgi:hypothetical protein
VATSGKRTTERGRLSWPKPGTGRTAPLATCGHCGGGPMIIRRCGIEGNTRGIRFCAVCGECGAHRKVHVEGERPTNGK